MRQLIVILITFSCLQGTAQTDVIKYKSHSGNFTKFISYTANNLDGTPSNFGGPELTFHMPEFLSSKVLDSVCRISNTSAVIVSKLYSNLFLIDNGDSIVHINEDGSTQMVTRENNWELVRDTVHQGHLYVETRSLDGIKDIVGSIYDLKFSPVGVVFKGYIDEDQEVKDGRMSPKNIQGLAKKDAKKGSVGLILLLGILVPILLVYVIGPIIFGWSKANHNSSKSA
ncbi:MAG: hypothetical protein ACI837_000731 [Crocinitomicaceae bacterium]|jgi:hypothetical protein